MTNNLVFITIVLGFVILILIIAWVLSKKKEPKWKNEIKQRLNSLNTSNLEQIDIIKHDKLLDYALKTKYNSKLTIGELLKLKGKYLFKQKLDQIWWAHKLRNKIAHELDYKLSQNETNKCIIVLREAIEIVIN